MLNSPGWRFAYILIAVVVAVAVVSFVFSICDVSIGRVIENVFVIVAIIELFSQTLTTGSLHWILCQKAC